MDGSPDWRFTHTSAGNVPPTTSFAKPPNSYPPANNVKAHAPLPPLAHIDVNKIRRDRQDNHESPKHLSPISTTAASMPALNSPSFGYPGPPPPYSSIVTTPSSTVMAGGHVGYPAPAPTTATEVHRVDEQRLPSQSLPSIHEALGKDSGSFHRPSLQTSSIPPPPGSITAPSPTTPVQGPRAGSFSSHPPNPYELHHPPRPAEPPARPALDTFQKDPRSEDVRRFPFDNQPAPRPASPRNPVRQASHSQPATPSFFNNATHGAFSHVQQPQPYTQPYPPAYSYPPPSSYPNQTAPLSAWRPELPPSEYGRAEDDKRGHLSIYSGRRSPGAGQYPHGESVKRHLETFDLELALNELLEGSNRTQDFARKYVDKSHHMQRSGIATALPSLAECDEMYNLQRSILNSVDRIRDIVVTQQHALAEQRSREEANKAKQSTFAGQFNDNVDKGDGEGGFAGSDPKKRRGRHAPPGRCHSCARSETPEWRRGPDGARTLCNACGLHYAKLTRKLGPKASLPGSNLRSKEDNSP